MKGSPQSLRSPPLFAGEKQKTVQVRLPLTLRQKLQTAADANCRSMAQEIQFRLLRDLKANEYEP